MATPAGLMAGAFASAFRVPTVAAADGSLFHFNQVQWRLLAQSGRTARRKECWRHSWRPQRPRIIAATVVGQ